MLTTWRQSYKRNLIFDKSQLVLNALTVCNLNLDYIIVLI